MIWAVAYVLVALVVGAVVAKALEPDEGEFDTWAMSGFVGLLWPLVVPIAALGYGVWLTRRAMDALRRRA